MVDSVFFGVWQYGRINVWGYFKEILFYICICTCVYMYMCMQTHQNTSMYSLA